MKLSVYCLPIAFLLASCSSNMKRVMVFAKGSASINTDTKTIVVKDGGGSEEKTADFNQSGILNLKLMKEDGENSLVMSDNGLYVVNAKNDTIIGSYQKYGEVPKEMRKFTQDELKKGIDSLIELTQNKNISAANRNFFILPYQSVKISNNIDAFVVAPYHRMTSLEKEAGKEPEVYRFWSIKEIRETIDKLQKMTVALPVSSTK